MAPSTTNQRLAIDIFGWGLLLWFVGYLLGIVFFMILPHDLIGWIIMPIGIAMTLWVLEKYVAHGPMSRYLLIAIGWTVIAIVCDYFLLVKVFKPADGYYKLDVYVYYVVTFLLPLFVGWKSTQK